MRIARGFVLVALGFAVGARAAEDEAAAAVTSINQTGLELFREMNARADNPKWVISPYSLQSSLALAYVGARDDTRKEMQRVLHFPDRNSTLTSSYAALRESVQLSVSDPAAEKSLEFAFANRAYAQTGFPFLADYLGEIRRNFQAELVSADFKTAPETVRASINDWVAGQTKGRITDALAPGSLMPDSRLVLVNALYFKAPWLAEFAVDKTEPDRFFLPGAAPVEVPTMHNLSGQYGYRDFGRFEAVTLPYVPGGFQFVVVLPKKNVPVDEVASRLSAEILLRFRPEEIRGRNYDHRQQVDLHLPRFRIECGETDLTFPLKQLGLKTAFDDPKLSAHFEGIWTPTSEINGYAALSKVIQGTFISVDENGTEAAAATEATIVLSPFGVDRTPPPKPVVVRVNRPFLFLLQHCETGACLFIGRVDDPR